MSNQLFDIALSLVFRHRLRRALALVDHYGSAEAAWASLHEPGMADCMEQAKKELDWINEHGIRVWTLADEDYPWRLKQCPDKPLVLYGKGNIAPSEGHFVSIVGTRRPTEHGKELTRRLVKDLHERLDQLTVVSGGAYGIDIAAHRAALEFGVPTLLIPAHGLDRIYPYQHRRDAIAILQRGGLLTEFPSGTEPLPAHFLQRNRIIAGLSDVTVVVESKERGGSLVTANMALDYNRELVTFPGRPEDESSKGCNDLIRADKAHLIGSADDLIALMGWKTRDAVSRPVQTTMVGLLGNLSDVQQTLLDKLQEAEDGLHINFLVMETALPYETVSSELMMLELEGLVRSLPGGFYRFMRQ